MKLRLTWTREQFRWAILLTLGTAGAVNELFLHPSHNPTTAALIGALLGLPYFLGRDESKKKDPPPDDPEKAYIDALLKRRRGR